MLCSLGQRRQMLPALALAQAWWQQVVSVQVQMMALLPVAAALSSSAEVRRGHRRGARRLAGRSDRACQGSKSSGHSDEEKVKRGQNT